jgi:peroxiredoxin
MRHTLLLALALAGCATSTSSGPAPSGASSALPDFELTSIDGDRVRLSDHLGKDVVVLSFWATWCEPCKTELPQLDRIYTAHQAQGLTLLSIAMDDPSTVSGVAPFVKRNGFHFPVLLDSETKAAALYNKLKSAPYTVVIDRSGKIVSEKTGYEPGAEKALEDELVQLLGATR